MDKISQETRKEANQKVDKEKREVQVLSILIMYAELTPKQITKYMVDRKYVDDLDFNHVRPRLTGLLEKREVCIVGKVLDKKTNCKQAVYQITQKGKDRLSKNMVEQNMNHITQI